MNDWVLMVVASKQTGGAAIDTTYFPDQSSALAAKEVITRAGRTHADIDTFVFNLPAWDISGLEDEEIPF